MMMVPFDVEKSLFEGPNVPIYNLRYFVEHRSNFGWMLRLPFDFEACTCPACSE